MKNKNDPKNSTSTITQEQQRLDEIRGGKGAPWRAWGPYLSERSWGTVREDYSPDGGAWGFLSHEMARSKAYRWGEDGLGGFADRYQLLCFGLALWNGRDPILKERVYGLTPHEGNHGEDPKDYYYYLDSTPTHSYMRYLYKYPQAEFPYQQLIDENRRREGRGAEYELLDTGIFNEDRYFDVFIEYAKAGPDDICIRIDVHNRGPEDALAHIIPNLWFRNIWSWGETAENAPNIEALAAHEKYVCMVADDTHATGLSNLPFKYTLGPRRLYGESDGEMLFTDNETNTAKLYGPAAADGRRYVKDAFHRHIIHGEDCVNPEQRGTKACLHYQRTVPAGGHVSIRLRLTKDVLENPLADVDADTDIVWSGLGVFDKHVEIAIFVEDTSIE